jgi:putative toxin-antitoxin system antitoxin component (TIGR02293 family)
MAVDVTLKRAPAAKTYIPLYQKMGMKTDREAVNPSVRIANAEKIRTGLPYQLAVDLQKMLDVSSREFSRITGVNERTLARRRGGLLSAEESDRLSAVAKVVDQAMYAFGYNEAGMREWFKEPNPMLLHRRPIDLLFSHESIEEVSILLERFADGDQS